MGSPFFKTSFAEVRASAVLNGLTEQSSAEVDCALWSNVTFEVTYTPTDPANEIVMRPEVQQDDGGGAWVPARSATETGVPAAGVTEIALTEPRYTILSPGGAVTRSFDVSVHGYDKCRLTVWEVVGAGGAGTCRVRASRSHAGT